METQLSHAGQDKHHYHTGGLDEKTTKNIISTLIHII
jgi:hypothetical protein